jgi:hypothetical protein
MRASGGRMATLGTMTDVQASSHELHQRGGRMLWPYGGDAF